MKRIVVAVLSIFAAYAAVYFGNGLHILWISDGFLKLFIFICGVVATVLGVIFLVVAMLAIINDEEDDYRMAYISAASLILLSVVFGLLSAPFVQGPYPWQWVNMWSIIPVLAIVPTLLMFFSKKNPGA